MLPVDLIVAKLGQVRVDDWPLISPMSCLVSTTEFVSGPEVEIITRPQGATAGEKEYPPVVTATRFRIEFKVFGDVDVDGVAYDNPVAGYRANLAALRANVLDRHDPVRTVTYEDPDTGQILSGPIIFERWAPAEGEEVEWTSTPLGIVLPRPLEVETS